MGRRSSWRGCAASPGRPGRWSRRWKRAVLQQIAAIRGAVNGLMNEVLEGHIREHLGAEQASAEQRREDLELVVTALRSYLK